MLLDITFPRGCPDVLAPRSLRGAGAAPAPCLPELGVGPVSPRVVELLAGVRVGGNKMPLCLRGDGLTRMVQL